MKSPKPKKLRRSIPQKPDRLSDLPDCVLYHILSFLNAKQCIQTCVLSKRWQQVWKYAPSLKITSSDFVTLKNFSKFVARIFTHRDSSTALLALDFYRRNKIEPQLLERIVKYAVWRGVQRLRLSVAANIEDISPHIFACRSLTSLSLSVKPRDYRGLTFFEDSLDLPALTDLYLEHFTFRGEGGRDGRVTPFSGLPCLKSLELSQCRIINARSLCISSKTLVKLIIHRGARVGDCSQIDIFAPNLCSTTLTGTSASKNLCGRFIISNC